MLEVLFEGIYKNFACNSRDCKTSNENGYCFLKSFF